MKIGRTLPPAAAPIGIGTLALGVMRMVNGERELRRFKLELMEHFGVKHCYLVSSGKAAFTLSLLALRRLHPDRSEVIVPAFTCFSVPAAITRAGLKVRLCDQRQESLDFDFAKLAAMLPASQFSQVGANEPESSALTESIGSPAPETAASRILAVVPTHLFGYPSDVMRLRKLIQDPQIAVIEDAAQAMCEVTDGSPLGSLGDVAFFSLGRGKALSTVEGGVIITNRDDIAAALDEQMKNIPHYSMRQLLGVIFKAAVLSVFTHPYLHWLPRALPFLRLGETFYEPHFKILRMSSFQAALSNNWQRKIALIRNCRKENVIRWNEVLAKFASSVATFPNSNRYGLIRMPIVLKDRQKRQTLLQKSIEYGMGIMPTYPTSINLIPEFRETMASEHFPVADGYANQLITLPTHVYVSQQDVMEIRQLLSEVLR